MGLDIEVDATVAQVHDRLMEKHRYAKGEQADRIGMDLIHLGMLEQEQLYDRRKSISTRPGSYSGLHVVRGEYAKLQGWPVDAKGHAISHAEELTQYSHLINHSDCDGCYVPYDFEKPIWTDNELSIGSSVRLLEELRELESRLPLMDQYTREAWGAVYLPALASVTLRTMILFT